MENAFSVKLKSALIHAAIIIGVVILHTVVVDVAGIFLSTYSKVAGVVLPLLLTFYVIYAYRVENCNNVISYSKALGYGALVTVIYAIVVPIFSYVHMHYISPDLQGLVQAVAEDKMMERGLSDYQIENAMKSQEKFKTFGWSMIFGIPFTFIFGFIYSLIASAFLKKEPKDPFEGVE